MSVESCPPFSAVCEQEGFNPGAAVIVLLKGIRLISGSACFSCEINFFGQPCLFVSHIIATEPRNLAGATHGEIMCHIPPVPELSSVVHAGGSGWQHSRVPKIRAAPLQLPVV